MEALPQSTIKIDEEIKRSSTNPASYINEPRGWSG
jgi:hypothetical protein